MLGERSARAPASSLDAGHTWSAEPSGTNRDLSGVSCPSTATCYAVGANGTILTTKDGSPWAPASSSTAPATFDLDQIACPSVSTCYVTGNLGPQTSSVQGTGVNPTTTNKPQMLTTSDGGTTWKSLEGDGLPASMSAC